MYKILVFGSKSCQPCAFLKKELEARGVKYSYVDVELNPHLANEYLVTSLPTTVILNDRNIVVTSYIGAGKRIVDEIITYSKGGNNAIRR